MLAITHVPSPQIEHGERTFVAATSMDYQRSLDQHAAYCHVLEQCGARVERLEVNHDYPDCAFVEDTAVVLDELAILTSMGAETRRGEVDRMEPVLSRFRSVQRVELPGTIEGGDVLRVGRRLLVGLSSRTNAAGLAALEELVRPHGYGVTAVHVHGCLHLKTACTALDDDRLLVNGAWIDTDSLKEFQLVPVPPEEPWAANVARIGRNLCSASTHVKTVELLRSMEFDVHTVDLSEFAKAEAGPTCLSLLIKG